MQIAAVINALSGDGEEGGGDVRRGWCNECGSYQEVGERKLSILEEASRRQMTDGRAGRRGKKAQLAAKNVWMQRVFWRQARIG